MHGTYSDMFRIVAQIRHLLLGAYICPTKQATYPYTVYFSTA